MIDTSDILKSNKKSFLKQQVFIFFLICIISIQHLFSQDNQSNRLLDDRFLIEVGVFVPSQNVKLGADGETPNDEINWGETFNLQDNEATLFMHFEWRFSKNKKWKLAGEYFSVNNGNRYTLEEDIEFENITFNKGSFVRAGVEFSLFRVFVGRNILAREKHLLGAGLGVHMMNVGAFIEGEILNSEEDLEFQSSRVSATVPLPNIGAWYIYTPHPRWFLGARVDWFGLTIDQYSGSLWNIAPQVKFQILKNLGLGLDYRFLFIGAKVNQSKWNGEFNMDFSGPLFTIHANF